jgi:very-short-patch-repair endonuclease
MARNIRRAGERQEQHGPVKVIFSQSDCPIVDDPDPANRKARLAARYRQNAPESERTFAAALTILEPHGIFFQHSVPLYGYIGDFYSPRHKLLIEIDGPVHAKRRKYDRIRDWHLKQKGIRTVRFPTWRLDDLNSLMADVAYLVGLDPTKVLSRS